MSEINVKEKFLKMMQTPDVGHNGGKPEADLWFVGLENNAGTDCEAHNKELLAGTKIKLDLEHQDFKSTFNQKLRELSRQTDCVEVSQMYENGNFYCANLYPFAFQKITQGTDEIRDLTGYYNKRQYQFAVDLMRREINKTLLTSNPNRIIVCFSVDFAENFMIQFIDNNALLGHALVELWKHLARREKYFQIEIGSDRIKKMVFCPHSCAPGFNTESVKELIKR